MIIKYAASGAIFKGPFVLLIKREQEPYINKWTLPGGRLIPPETFQQCIIREIKEEVGMNVRVVSPLI